MKQMVIKWYCLDIVFLDHMLKNLMKLHYFDNHDGVVVSHGETGSPSVE